MLDRAFDVVPAGDGRRRVRPPTASRRAPLRPEHGLQRLLELHLEQHASLATVAAALNHEGYRTPAGLRWHPASVARAIADATRPAGASR